MSGTLLKSLFGIFVAENTSVEARKNILLLSKEIWKYCRDDIKYDLGEKKLLLEIIFNKTKRILLINF